MDIHLLIQTFDVERYLQHKRIPYYTHGRNVKRGWIGMKCLWCSDHSNHMGINLTSKALSCWKCSLKGTVLKLVMRLENQSVYDAQKTMEQFSNVSLLADNFHRKKERVYAEKFDFDKSFTREIKPYCRNFLQRRGFDPEYIYSKYRLLSGPTVGQYKFSVIIPYYSYKTPLTFIARHVKHKIYCNCPIEKSVQDPKNLIYNYDSCKETALVVEGVTDVWNIGDGCVATAGSKFTPRQVELLSEFSRVYILFDPEDEAQENAEKLGYLLSAHVPTVERLDLGVDHDPAELPQDDVKVLRNQIFNKIY